MKITFIEKSNGGIFSLDKTMFTQFLGQKQNNNCRFYRSQIIILKGCSIRSVLFYACDVFYFNSEPENVMTTQE